VPGKLILNSSRQRRMVDEAVDAYVEWREECVRVWQAYQGWLDAARVDGAFASLAYEAALDREQRAAEVYAELIARLETRLRNLPPSRGEHENPASRASRQ
jgi:hypothetical protein